MSLIPPSQNQLLQFYLSSPMPCAYVPDRMERKLFTRLKGNPELDITLNGSLTRMGFRRSHNILYRPACDTCRACVPVRIPVRDFMPSRSLRRLQKRNQDLRLEIVGVTIQLDESYALFRDYEKARHPDSDMAQMSQDDFTRMLREGEAGTQLYQVRNPTGALVACMIVDPVDEGASAVYSFFTPLDPQRSLGTQMILTLIEEMQKQNQPYLYLGYWIEASRKMTYKTRFHPLQALGAQGWSEMIPQKEA